MTAPFRLYGAELSPYSLKVRSYLRFKGLEFEWLARSNARQEEFARYAKLPLIPLLVDANEAVLQDSTPIIEALEAEYPEPSITPADPALAFLSALLEDYADEWLNKAMFHYRWSYPADQESAAQRIATVIFDGAPPEGAEEGVRTRMTARLYHVGSSPETAPVIEASFQHLLALLEPMLASRPYIFGGTPSLADFGLAGQLAQLLSDPTPGAIIRAQAPNIVRWLSRMENPRVEGGFASFDEVRAQLADLIRGEVAGAYLVWMSANADAVANDAPAFTVSISEAAFSQKPQRYAARALAALRAKRAAIGDNAALQSFLQETGAESVLAAATPASDDAAESDDDGDEE